MWVHMSRYICVNVLLKVCGQLHKQGTGAHLILSYRTHVTKFLTSRRRNCCMFLVWTSLIVQTSRGVTKVKHTQIFKVLASLKGKSQTFTWELRSPLIHADAKCGPSLSKDSTSEPSQEISQILLSLLSLPWPVCTKINHPPGFQDCTFAFASVHCPNQYAAPGATPKDSGGKHAAITVSREYFHFLPLSASTPINHRRKYCTF